MLNDEVSASPYAGVDPKLWEQTTRILVKKHPLGTDEIVRVTLKSWDDIFESQFGSKPFRIGVHIFPRPQIMSFLLHELIPLQLNAEYPKTWRGDESANEKDLVYVPDQQYSVEIKASSSGARIYGNRSYAQPSVNAKKSKSGYLLAINFEKFSKNNGNPRIRRIRFGWLDHVDWLGQSAATGQQARLNKVAEQTKLLLLFDSKGTK